MPSFRSVRHRVQRGEALNWREMRKTIRGIRWMATGAACAVALPLAVLASHLSICAAGKRLLQESALVAWIYPDVMGVLCGLGALMLAVAGALGLLLRTIWKTKLLPEEKGVRYWRMCREKNCRGYEPGLCYAAASCAAGIVVAWIAPELLTPEAVFALLAVEILTVGLGAGAAVRCFVQRLCFARVRVDGAEDLRPEKRRRRWFLLYWLVLLALYAGASVAFQSGTLFLFVPMAGLFLYGLGRWVNGRVRFCPWDRILTALRGLIAAALTAALAAAIVLSGSWINNLYLYDLDYSVFSRDRTEVRYDAETGVYTLVPREGELRILQLTDLHIGGSLPTVFSDRKAFRACYELIREAQPDLIVITGDIAYPIPIETFTLNNKVPFSQLRYFMDMVDLPWTFVYGNHDTEAYARYDADAIQQEYASYARVNREMLFADVQPDIYGRYNQYIRVERPDGTLQDVLFLMDSNDYAQGPEAVGKYDSVHPDQIAWYRTTLSRLEKENGRVIPSFVFMHIPFQAFAQAQAALEAGDPEAQYLFGKNEEPVSAPEKESGFFQAMLQMGSTRAVFVGHDHLNNLGVRYKGVDLVFSKSIDYIAYPGIAGRTGQRGATLITLRGDEYEIRQLSYQEPAN